MFCSQVQFRRQGDDFTDIKLLPCRSWGCEVCAPNRRKQLMAIAASGLPSICLTLTSNASNTGTPTSRYRELHSAWRDLVKRITRQFKKAPEKRWVLTTEEGYQYQDTTAYYITSRTKVGNVKRLHYMAFAEETKQGEPHLHILLRTKYIPQRWLSQQMAELLNSPVLWIEKIKSVKSTIAYVAKYVTKAPAQFGKSRRYWVSRYYQVNTPDKHLKGAFSRQNSQLVFQRFEELIREIITKGQIPQVISRTQIRIRTIRQWAIARGTQNDGEEEVAGAVAYHWLNSWRQRLRI